MPWAKNSNKSYIISVSLGKGCYRHIKISASSTLYDLHTAIINVFEFDDDHAHAFFMDNHTWSHDDSYYADIIEDDNRFTKDYRLYQVLSVGKKFKYIFDFGDEWTFQCCVLHETDEVCEKPAVIRSKGNAPSQYEDNDDNDDNDDEDDEDDDDSDQKALTKKDEALPKTQLPEEVVRNILMYFDAFANLYGIISIDNAIEIYNSQNEAVSREAFSEVVEIAEEEENYIIIGDDKIAYDELVLESLYGIKEEYDRIKKSQEGKPFYIPVKEELLKYTDALYYEKNNELYTVLEFLKKEFNLSEDDAEDFTDEVQVLCATEEKIGYIIADMERIGIEFKDIEQIVRFAEVQTALANNTRLCSKRGHTNGEMNNE